MLNQLKIVAVFLTALAAGNATFYVTIKGTKYLVNLVKNGNLNAPNLSAIVTLSNAALGLIFANLGSANVKIGASNWTVSVTAV